MLNSEIQTFIVINALDEHLTIQQSKQQLQIVVNYLNTERTEQHRTLEYKTNKSATLGASF